MPGSRERCFRTKISTRPGGSRAFLHVQGLAGRDKVTLLLPRAWAGAGVWTKQDFEESLGKSTEYGLKIVIGERVRLTNYRAPKDPTQDRVFWCVQFKGEPDGARKSSRCSAARAIRVAVLTLPGDTPLSRYMQFIHYVVFGLAWLRKINFVTQPNVELYKSITSKLHAEAERAGGIAKTKEWRQTAESPRKSVWRGRVTLRWDRLPAVDRSAKEPPLRRSTRPAEIFRAPRACDLRRADIFRRHALFAARPRRARRARSRRRTACFARD